MDVSLARAHGRDLEAGEFCSALVSVDGNLIRRHRSLRNQLCLTRTAAAFLLLVCTSLSAVIYIQHRASADASEHSVNNEGQTEKLQMDKFDNTILDPTKNKNFTTLKMSRPPYCDTVSVLNDTEVFGTIQWEKTQITSPNFKLTDDKKSLIFHQQGWYQITLQITYQLRKKKHLDLSHYLIRKSEGYPVEEKVLSVYDVVFKRGKKSVHSAKMVSFQKGDLLKVNSTLMENLYCETNDVETANFLMAQLITPNI